MRKIKITNMEDHRSARTVFVSFGGNPPVEIRPGREAILDIPPVDGALIAAQPVGMMLPYQEGLPVEGMQIFTESELLDKTNAELEEMGGEGRVKAELVASILAKQAEELARNPNVVSGAAAPGEEGTPTVNQEPS